MLAQQDYIEEYIIVEIPFEANSKGISSLETEGTPAGVFSVSFFYFRACSILLCTEIDMNIQKKRGEREWTLRLIRWFLIFSGFGTSF